jgi:hypothetical protein
LRRAAPIGINTDDLSRRRSRDMSVRKQGDPIDIATAVQERQNGNDVVVCGSDVVANMRVGQEIESRATGNRFKFDRAHVNRGRFALSHFQPNPRPPAGPTFVESPPDRVAQ